jgi:hypothetical protein
MTKIMMRRCTFTLFVDNALDICLAKSSGTVGRQRKLFAPFYSTTHRKLASHFRKIRTEDEEPIALGYDARHRQDDPLWQSEGVI